MPLLDHKVSTAIRTLQLLDDAIAFRFGRLDQARYAAAFCDAIAGMDPSKIDQILLRGDGIPPTAALHSSAVLIRVLEIAAEGTVVTDPAIQTR